MSASLTQAGDATLDVSNLVARPVSRGMRSRRPPLSSRLSSRRGAPSGNNSARVRTPRLPPPPVPRIAEGSLQELVAAGEGQLRQGGVGGDNDEAEGGGAREPAEDLERVQGRR